ncbi:unnamed protein product [Caretta caretta]
MAPQGHGEEPVPWIRYTKDSQPLRLDSPVHSLQPGRGENYLPDTCSWREMAPFRLDPVATTAAKGNCWRQRKHPNPPQESAPEVKAYNHEQIVPYNLRHLTTKVHRLCAAIINGSDDSFRNKRKLTLEAYNDCVMTF